VSIFAKELRFEDKADAGEDGSARIITTPRANELLPPAASLGANRYSPADDVPAGDGEPGLAAGGITVHADRIVLPQSAEAAGRVRFVLRGGKGQAAGPGCAGAAGVSLNPTTEPFASHYLPGGVSPSKVVYYYLHERRGGDCECSYDGWHPDQVHWDGVPKAWPGDGGDAVSAGVPGTGGSGGAFRARLGPGAGDLEQLCDIGGGASGD
jgi:hypothetical protein